MPALRAMPLTALLAVTSLLTAPGLPRAAAAPADERLVVIRAGAVLTVTGEELRPGMIVIRDGEIEAVGERVEIPPRARVIDAPDEVVMPGLVDPRSRFALRRYGRGGNNAHLSVEPELFFRPGDLRPLLEAGFVAVGLVPAGRGIAGQAATIRPLWAEDPHALLLPGATYLRISMDSLPSDKRTLRGAFEEAEKAIARVEKARKAWEAKQKKRAAAAKKEAAEAKKKGKKKATKKGDEDEKKKGDGDEKKKDDGDAEFKPPPIPARARPFVAILQGKEDRPRLLVEVGRASDLVHLDDGFARYEHFQPMLLLDNSGASDLHLALERCAAAPLVLLRPEVTYEPFTRTRRNLPAELAAAGARIALIPLSDDAEGHRGLLEAVGFLVRDGLPRGVALKAVTLHAAEALGLGAELGAIEAGRRADLLFLDGDPLGPAPRVTRVMIGGELRHETGGTP